MKKVKKGLRLLVMVLLLTLAAFGVGLAGSLMNNSRYRYMDKEIRTELTEKKEDEEEESRR